MLDCIQIEALYYLFRNQNLYSVQNPYAFYFFIIKKVLVKGYILTLTHRASLTNFLLLETKNKMMLSINHCVFQYYNNYKYVYFVYMYILSLVLFVNL